MCFLPPAQGPFLGLTWGLPHMHPGRLTLPAPTKLAGAPTCGQLAVGPAIRPRTIRPDLALNFSPAFFVSEAGSDGCSFSLFSHAGATAGPSAGTAGAGLLLWGGLLDDTKFPRISPSRWSCLQKRSISVKTDAPKGIANHENHTHVQQALPASPLTNPRRPLASQRVIVKDKKTDITFVSGPVWPTK